MWRKYDRKGIKIYQSCTIESEQAQGTEVLGTQNNIPEEVSLGLLSGKTGGLIVGKQPEKI